MSSMVSNLLDMARLQSGNVQLNREWQTLEEVVGSISAKLVRRHPHVFGQQTSLTPAASLLFQQLVTTLLVVSSIVSKMNEFTYRRVVKFRLQDSSRLPRSQRHVNTEYTSLLLTSFKVAVVGTGVCLAVLFLPFLVHSECSSLQSTSKEQSKMKRPGGAPVVSTTSTLKAGW